MRSILILNARRRVFLVKMMREYILKKNMDLKVITSDTDMLDPIRFFSDGFRVLPHVSDAQFMFELEKYIKEENIIGLMIWNDKDFKYIDSIRDTLITMGVKVLLPSKEIIEICNDKRNTYQFIRQLDCLTPKIHEFDKFEYFNNIDFPLFIKPYDGAGSVYCYKIENKSQLESVYDKIPNAIVQDYIDGNMYTVDVFCDYECKPLCIVPRVRLKVRDSEALIARVDMDDNIISLTRTIVGELNVTGPINLQFIKKNDGRIYLIEINCRVSGGIDLSIAANAPFHIWLIQYFLNQEFDKPTRITNNLVMTRYYDSVFFEET